MSPLASWMELIFYLAGKKAFASNHSHAASGMAASAPEILAPDAITGAALGAAGFAPGRVAAGKLSDGHSPALEVAPR